MSCCLPSDRTRKGIGSGNESNAMRLREKAANMKTTMHDAFFGRRVRAASSSSNSQSLLQEAPQISFIGGDKLLHQDDRLTELLGNGNQDGAIEALPIRRASRHDSGVCLNEVVPDAELDRIQWERVGRRPAAEVDWESRAARWDVFSEDVEISREPILGPFATGAKYSARPLVIAKKTSQESLALSTSTQDTLAAYWCSDNSQPEVATLVSKASTIGLDGSDDDVAEQSAQGTRPEPSSTSSSGSTNKENWWSSESSDGSYKSTGNSTPAISYSGFLPATEPVQLPTAISSSSRFTSSSEPVMISVQQLEPVGFPNRPEEVNDADENAVAKKYKRTRFAEIGSVDKPVRTDKQPVI